MYPDFMWVAADQVFNQIGKARHMFGGDNPVPLVLRTKVAMGSGYGSQHLMDPAGIFATSPGWRIVAPSTAADYVGLMNAALALEDPVLVIEHVDLYGQMPTRFPRATSTTSHPAGQRGLRREGGDVTVISYLSMVRHCVEAIEQTGVDAELIDLRWLDRASIDWETIEASVKKTNAVLIVEQGARGTSYGGWLADEIQRRYFDWLDQPVAAGDRRRGAPEHLEGARARRNRPHRGSRRGHRDRARKHGGCADGDDDPHARGARGRHRGRGRRAGSSAWATASRSAHPLAEIETEKAVVEFASEVEGTVLELIAAEGAGVAIGDPIIVVGAPGETVDSPGPVAAESSPQPSCRLSPRLLSPRPPSRCRRSANRLLSVGS